MPFGQNGEKDKEWASKGGYAKAAIYELDRMQMEKMRRIVDKDLEIIERIQNQEVINPVDERRLQISQTRVAKYLDKLHASKNSLEGKDGEPLIIQIAESIAKKNDIITAPEHNSTGQT